MIEPKNKTMKDLLLLEEFLKNSELVYLVVYKNKENFIESVTSEKTLSGAQEAEESVREFKEDETVVMVSYLDFTAELDEPQIVKVFHTTEATEAFELASLKVTEFLEV